MILLWSSSDCCAYPLEVAETMEEEEIKDKWFTAFKDTEHGKTGRLSDKLHLSL